MEYILIDDIKTILPKYSKNIELNWPIIDEALTKMQINSRNTSIAAVGTVIIETGIFSPIKEFGGNAYFKKKYEGRQDLGNVLPGDGVNFCGRGFIQITGRANYRNYGIKLGVDLENDPELALKPEISAQILAKYFKDKKIHIWAESLNWQKIRKLVNGGLNGFEKFNDICQKLI